MRIPARDIWVLPLESRKPFSILHSEFNESSGQFSPDMRWVTYVSNESGPEEVYVRAFSPNSPEPASTGPLIVSKGGGTAPKWRQDGEEIIYFRPDGKLMAAAITTGSVFQLEAPRELAQLAKGGGPADVARDGRILQAGPARQGRASCIHSGIGLASGPEEVIDCSRTADIRERDYGRSYAC